MKHNYWEGKAISPVPISENMTITQLVDEVFDGMGYNAKRLAEACRLFKTMIDERSTVCLTLAGAMASGNVGGLSGTYIPVSKDSGSDYKYED